MTQLSHRQAEFAVVPTRLIHDMVGARPSALKGAIVRAARGLDRHASGVKIGETDMNFLEAIGSGLGNYINFSDRAARPEYWYWIVPVVIINIVLGVADQTLHPGTQMGALSWVTMIVFLASILPTVGVSVRRLHDIDRSGWWFLLWFTLVGGVVVIYWACQQGTAGPNSFGEPPTK
jgi:uncharacterized membrane protein YhaH (DUF805 family)